MAHTCFGLARRGLVTSGALVVAAFTAASPALAQQIDFSQGVDVQLFHPAKDAYGFFSTETGDVNAHLKLNAGLYFNYAYKPLSVVFEGTRVSAGEIIANRLDADVLVAFGLFDIVEIGLDMPVVLFQNGGTTEQVRSGAFGDANASLSAASLGDIHIQPKGRFLFLGEGKLSMAAAVDVVVPTGNENAFTGEAGLVVAPLLAISTTTDMFRAAFDIGYRWRQEHVEVMTLEAADELFYRAGLGLTFGSGDALYEAAAEVYGHTSVSNPWGLRSAAGAESQNPMELLVGLTNNRGVAFGELIYGGGVGFGLLPGYGSPAVRVFARIGYYMGEAIADADQDGLADDRDKCPDQAEDLDDYQDDDGCADADNDNDTVLDEDDNCPNEAEDKDGYKDDDGCPEPDNDLDGLTDKIDACPTEAEDKDGYQDADGCPEPDNDGDGVFDEYDKCPDQKEDKDSYQDDDGCPDLDNDGDAMPDLGDVCPLQAEDKDGYQDDDGCPDPDNDGDGILDKDDKCPVKPEVINGVDDSDGCPDQGKTLVQVTKEKIVIKETVQFGTGSAKILPKSFGLLDQVASVLVNHKEIIKLRVEGHTDSVGNKKKNIKLSQDRADSVMQYLIGKGVEAGRLEAQGFGPTKPIASNKTARGRETNRRVEFTILEQKTMIEMIEVPAQPEQSTQEIRLDGGESSTQPATTQPPAAAATTSEPAATDSDKDKGKGKGKGKGKKKGKDKDKQGGDQIDIGEISF